MASTVKFNVFEGARRIVLLIQSIIVLVFFWTLFVDSPYVSLKYATTQPDQPFLKMPNDFNCDSTSSSSEYITRKTKGGDEVSITLCFMAQIFPQGMLVPYKIDKDKIWGAQNYSQPVQAYTDGRALSFTLDEVGEKAARSTWWKEKWKDI